MSRSVTQCLYLSKVNNPGRFLLIDSRGTYLGPLLSPSVLQWLQDGGRDRQRCHDPAGGSASGRRRDRQLPAWPPCMLAAHVELRVHTHGPVRVDLWEGQSLDADKGPGASRNVTLSRAAGIRRTAHALASLESPSSYGRYGPPRAPGPLLWH